MPRTADRHVLAACDQVIGGVLTNTDVDGKTSEITCFQPLLDQIDDLQATPVYLADRLARRIARLSPEAVAAVKATVETITPKVPHHAYATENGFLYSLFTEDLVGSAHKQLAAGVQTREGERDLEGIYDSL